MPAVVEIISALERTSITEELLKTTRLGKYINELRRKTSNEALAKRAKELLKKWRDQVLPSSQSNTSTTAAVANGTATGAITKTLVNTFNSDRSNSPDLIKTLNHKKRPLSSLAIEDSSSNGRKRIKMNGRHMPSEQIYISDNSNSSPRVEKKIQNIVVNINSDSNSSLHEVNDRVPPVNDTNLTFAGRNLGGIKSDSLLQKRVPTPTPQQPPPSVQKPEPKKRGRKKGSKNHKTLLVQAEESFTNKMAVSVNAKVKTTQELLASIQNKSLSSTNLVNNSVIKTEKIISPKVNNVIEGVSSPKIALEGIVKNEKSKLANLCDSRVSSPKLENKFLKREIFRSDSPVKVDLDSENSRSSFQESVPSACITREGSEDESDIIEVGGDSVKDDSFGELKKEEKPEIEEHSGDDVAKQETVEDILAKLPKVDRRFLYEESEEPQCTCVQPVVKNENITIEFHESTQQQQGSSGSIFDVPDSFSTSGDDNSEVNTSRTTVVTNEISVPEPLINSDCLAKRYLEQKYRLGEDQVTDERVHQLHTRFIDSVNGNKCEKTANRRYCDVIEENSGLYSNIVPNFHAGEIIRKDITLDSINYIKFKKILPYPNLCVDNERTKCCDDDDVEVERQHDEQLCLSSSYDDHGQSQVTTVSSNVGDNQNFDDTQSLLLSKNSQESKSNHDHHEGEDESKTTHENFREFHECVSLRSYNDELLHILPYVVLD